MQRLPKASKPVFNKVLFGLVGAVALTGSGCTGRNIHKDLADDPAVLVRRWTLSTHAEVREAGDHGTEYSSPVFHENTLIFGNRSVGLTSIYPLMNQQRWSLAVRNGVVSELALGQGNVYFGGGDGFFYSVNAETGQVNWRYELRNPSVSRPALSGGRVFVTTSDDTVVALDAGTGKWLWHYRRRSAGQATIQGASSPLVDNGEVLTGLSDGYLVALNEQDGQLKWERKLHTGSKFTDVDAHPVLDQGLLYVPSYDGALYALKRDNGNGVWRYDAGGSKTVAVEGDRIFMPSSEGAVHAIQRDNAKMLWKFELDGGTPTQIVLTEKYLIVGSSQQYLYVVDKLTGKGLYRFNAGYGSGFSGSPAYDANQQRIYALSGGGNLYAFSLRKPVKKVRPHGQTDPYQF